MTETDERYKNGKIYRLVSSLTTEVYIGSTIRTLNYRLNCHMTGYKQFLKKERCDCTSFRLFEKGIDEVKIELIEKYSCNCKSELEKRERYWIENTVNCVNKNIPTRTVKEYCQYNRGTIAEKKKKRYQTNRETILEKYQNNRDIRLGQMKNYYHSNRENILEKMKVKITCECGSTINKGELTRHKKTKKHTNYIATQLTNNLTQLTI